MSKVYDIDDVLISLNLAYLKKLFEDIMVLYRSVGLPSDIVQKRKKEVVVTILNRLSIERELGRQEGIVEYFHSFCNKEDLFSTSEVLEIFGKFDKTF